MSAGRFPYELIEPIAAGGMAEVWRARPVAGGADVAVKLMRKDLIDDPELRSCFEDESRVMSRVNHPRVVRYLDAGELDGRPWLAMEYVRGVNLAQVLRQLRLLGRTPSLAVIRAIGDDLLAALDAAHRAADETGRPLGLVHRDVTPQNLLLCEDGTCKLTDFGIAKDRNQCHVTQTGVVKGKTGYLAPEQAGMGEVDGRADIWAAGVLLYELTGLSHPFAGLSEADTLRRIRAQPIVPLTRIRTDVPEAFDQVVRKAMERPPENRWADAAAFANAVAATLPPTEGQRALRALLRAVYPGGLPGGQPLPIARAEPFRKTITPSPFMDPSAPATPRPGRRLAGIGTRVALAGAALFLGAGIAFAAQAVYERIRTPEPVPVVAPPLATRRAPEPAPPTGPLRETPLTVGEPYWEEAPRFPREPPPPPPAERARSERRSQKKQKRAR